MLSSLLFVSILFSTLDVLEKLVQCTGLSNQNTTAFIQHITHTSYVKLVLLIKLVKPLL